MLAYGADNGDGSDGAGGESAETLLTDADYDRLLANAEPVDFSSLERESLERKKDKERRDADANAAANAAAAATAAAQRAERGGVDGGTAVDEGGSAEAELQYAIEHDDAAIPLSNTLPLTRAAESPVSGLLVQGGKRKRKQVTLYQPPANSLTRAMSGGANRKPLRHDDECFGCLEGGDLLECDACPRVYHLPCVGLGPGQVPKGVWRCPWHACWECERTSSRAGGLLFHCMTCPEAYCFDCCPKEYVVHPTAEAKALQAVLAQRGLPGSADNYLFYTCSECKGEGRGQRAGKTRGEGDPQL
jgi:hypothetical protein